MFGKNPIRSAATDPHSLYVQEHFLTLQGEGPQAGRRALFIRLAGCNLACHFCDTEFESGMAAPRVTEVLLRELVERYDAAQREFVVLTGGEPLRQNVTELLRGLYATGTKLVQVETAGTLWVPGLELWIERGVLQLVCSPKTPRVDINIRSYCEHWKYIIRAGELADDGLPRRGTQVATKDKLSHLYRPLAAFPDPGIRGVNALGTIWVSPCDDYDAEKNAANVKAAVEVCLKHGYRLSLQVHKLVGVA